MSSLSIVIDLNVLENRLFGVSSGSEMQEVSTFTL